MRKLARHLIVIGAALGLCAGGLPPLSARGAGAQYLIVTTEALAPGFADLATFRSSPEGGSLTVRMTTIEEIHAARQEATPEARIRAAIAAEYASGDLRWVVLGARADAIAPVMVWTPVEGIANNWTKSRGTPSDWYYACLSNDWTATETGFYGYSDFTKIDLVPEVAVGRIPAVTVEGVRDYVRRLRRYTSRASSLALRADHVLLHGLKLGSAAPTDTGKMTELSDGYPWIGDEGHPSGTTDSELWLRNIYLSRILANRPGATLDLFFPGACGDPATRSSFTAELSIDRPADLYRYLAERPEFVAMSSHGLPAGVGRLSPSSALAPGCAWGVLYSVGCNTAQFDAPSLADNGGATGMAPPEDHTGTVPTAHMLNVILRTIKAKGVPKSAVGGKKSGKKTGKKTEGRILDLLARNSKLTFAGMVAALGISRSAIQKHIEHLKDAQRLRRVGPDKGGRWEVA